MILYNRQVLLVRVPQMEGFRLLYSIFIWKIIGWIYFGKHNKFRLYIYLAGEMEKSGGVLVSRYVDISRQDVQWDCWQTKRELFLAQLSAVIESVRSFWIWMDSQKRKFTDRKLEVLLIRWSAQRMHCATEWNKNPFSAFTCRPDANSTKATLWRLNIGKKEHFFISWILTFTTHFGLP